MRYDLHSHTVHSDGTYSVNEILNLAKEKKLNGLSITDHDSISAYEEAFCVAKELNLELLTGIEFSCHYGSHSVHILGYGFNHQDPEIIEFIAECQKVREDRNYQILEKLARYQMPIEADELCDEFQKEIKDIGRPHIAQIMQKRGYVKTFKEAFNLHIGDNKKCFVLGSRPHVEEVIRFLHKKNAFAILAHPHVIKSNNLLKKLLNLPFDGLEAYYARFGKKEENKWLNLAANRDWLTTGGSDFHGETKPLNELGSSWVDKKTFDHLKAKMQENYELQSS